MKLVVPRATPAARRGARSSSSRAADARVLLGQPASPAPTSRPHGRPGSAVPPPRSARAPTRTARASGGCASAARGSAGRRRPPRPAARRAGRARRRAAGSGSATTSARAAGSFSGVADDLDDAEDRLPHRRVEDRQLAALHRRPLRGGVRADLRPRRRAHRAASRRVHGQQPVLQRLRGARRRRRSPGRSRCTCSAMP